MTAIMGPSGCGKSSLLGCLFGSRKATSGSTIQGNKEITLAFVEQEDHLLGQLTIYEMMIFASKLKNADKFIDHSLVVNSVMKRLGIERCADIKADRCSGGQKRRISIALELVSRPNVLILDEPTTGLDSVTTHELVETLHELTRDEQPTAVMATIHQPSSPVFNMFDKIYILSHEGQCIYHGLPGEMMSVLNEIELVCPQYHNPADFVIEVNTMY